MEKSKERSPFCDHRKLGIALAGCVFLNIISIGFSAFIAIRWQSESSGSSEMMRRIARLEKSCGSSVTNVTTEPQEVRIRREIISAAANEEVPSALRNVIDNTVKREWSALQSSLPTHGGVFYTRWGHSSCPASSSMVYKGQMTGPSYQSVGGGPNWQCLPDDPDYSPTSPIALASSLRAAHYRLGSTVNHRIPCTVCETGKRVSQLMIPAKTRCPSSEWTLEYKGFLASTAEYESNSEDFQKDYYYRGSYVCIDEKEESLTGSAYERDGAQIYHVNAACGSASGALNNCPPYQANKALSCVVCSK